MSDVLHGPKILLREQGDLQRRRAAVQVWDTAPPRGQKPLEWLLLSSDGEPTKRDALRIVQRYESRWGIEEYFRVVKSGMRIQDRRLSRGAGLAKCLAFDAIEAWRVFQLDHYVIDTLSSRGQRDPVARVAGPATVGAHAAGGGREPGGPTSRIRRRSLSPSPHTGLAAGGLPLAPERPSRRARQRRVPRSWMLAATGVPARPVCPSSVPSAPVSSALGLATPCQANLCACRPGRIARRRNNNLAQGNTGTSDTGQSQRHSSSSLRELCGGARLIFEESSSVGRLAVSVAYHPANGPMLQIESCPRFGRCVPHRGRHCRCC